MDAMKVKRIAIVTGATGGLGREFVRLLLKEKNRPYKSNSILLYKAYFYLI